jgi:tetratricopeptide (TPR) repeat protein
MSALPMAHTMRQAEIHLRAGRTRPAEQLLQKVLAALPHHAQANSRLGTLLIQTGRPTQAVPHFRAACDAQPKAIVHWLRMISVHQLLGDTQAAEAALHEAAQDDWPQEALQRLAHTAFQPHEQRQRSLLSLYQSQQDAVTIEIAAHLFISDFPDHPLGWQILGAVFHDAGRLEEALRIKRETVERFPRDANAHNNLAHTLLALRRHEEALTSARTALALNPSIEQARQHEALAWAMKRAAGRD